MEYKMLGVEMCGFVVVSKVGRGFFVYFKWYKLKILIVTKIVFVISLML